MKLILITKCYLVDLDKVPGVKLIIAVIYCMPYVLGVLCTLNLIFTPAWQWRYGELVVTPLNPLYSGELKSTPGADSLRPS